MAKGSDNSAAVYWSMAIALVACFATCEVLVRTRLAAHVPAGAGAVAVVVTLIFAATSGSMLLGMLRGLIVGFCGMLALAGSLALRLGVNEWLPLTVRTAILAILCCAAAGTIFGYLGKK